MRIGIDARELCGHPTGVGRYLGGLLREWASRERSQRHDFVLYASEPIGLPLDSRRFATRIVPAAPGVWWEQVRLPKAAATDHLDVFFAPAYSAPLQLGVPVVVAIHDISFVAHPEWFRFREGIRRRWLTRSSARRAAAVVTISRFSRRELVDRLGVPEARVHVIPPGITALAPTRAPDNGNERRVLFVGSILNRRHVPDLLRAFSTVARRHAVASLDLVGDNRTYPHEDLQKMIGTAELTGRVRWYRYISDAALSDLYARAHAFAFLSEYEGLGLTPLEALASGLPPVVLDTEVARESCGPAALYVPRGDIGATSRALEEVLFDEALRARLLGAAPHVLAQYSWPRAAHDTLALIEQSA